MRKNVFPIILSAAIVMSAAVSLPMFEKPSLMASAENVTIESGLKLTKDTVYEGDLCLKDGVLDLNGYTLTIKGSLIQGDFLGTNKPSVVLNNGKLEVNGDYWHYTGLLNVNGSLHISGDYRQDRSGRGETTSGVLEMSVSNALMDVDGNATFWSDQTANNQKHGLLRIGGDLRVTDDGKCLQSWWEHTVEFKGNVTHKINFDSADVNYLNWVTVTDGGKLFLQGNTTGFILYSDMIFAADSTLRGNRTLNLNNQTLTVEGDFYQGGFLPSVDENPEVSVNGTSVMEVKGDYRHRDGVLRVDNQLMIHGDYRQDQNGRGELTDGILDMSHSTSLMDVDGDAVFWSGQQADNQKHGLLRIGGNLTVTGAAPCFQSWWNHTVDFKGDDVHTIKFANPDVNYLNRVTVTDSGKLCLRDGTTGFTLDSDAVFEADSQLRGSRPLKLNGHTLTVDGDFYQGVFLPETDENPEIIIDNAAVMNVNGDYRHRDGVLHVDNQLMIHGDYRQDQNGRGELTDGILDMSYSTSLMDVDGDAVFWSGQQADNQKHGLLHIGGNLTVTGAAPCFQSWWNHTVDFKGDDVHTIKFANPDVNYLNRVTVTDGGKLYLKDCTTGFTLDSDATFAANSRLCGNRALKLNGHTLTVDGNFYQGVFRSEKDENPEIDIPSNSVMNVNGDYFHLDGVLHENGALTILGNYRQDEVGRDESTDGILEMANSSSLMTVNGDVVFWSGQQADNQKHGLLRIGGNLDATSVAACFQPWWSHITEFFGKKEHKINFRDTNNHFNVIGMGVGDILNFTGHLSGVTKDSDSSIQITPAVASVEDMTVTGVNVGEGTIKFFNSKENISNKLIVAASEEEIEPPEPEVTLMGDVNADGEFSVSDVILMQKWILNVPDVHLTNWKNGDFDKNSVIDVFDLVQMKYELLAKRPPQEQKEPEVLVSNFNVYTVYNKPTAESTFKAETNCTVYSIMTYHWNNASGKTPGTISLLEDDKLIGTWDATGTDGQGGVKNANWTAYPKNLTLKAGHTYKIVDSDPDSWSQNGKSGNAGFFEIKGNTI